MQTLTQPTEKIFTDHNVDDSVMSNDDAMDAFRSKFPLICKCNVSKDGNLMVYVLKTMTGALEYLTDAQKIIGFLNLPLSARLDPVKCGNSFLNVYLQIIYNPNKK